MLLSSISIGKFTTRNELKMSLANFSHEISKSIMFGARLITI